jgi:hypothetical protein
MFQVFVSDISSVFQTFVVVSSGCCICFTHMLQVFYLDVTYVCNGFPSVLQVFQTHDANVSAVSYVCCKRFYLNISKIDRDVAHVAM